MVVVSKGEISKKDWFFSLEIKKEAGKIWTKISKQVIHLCQTGTVANLG